MLHRHLRWVLLAIPVSLAGQEAAGTQLWRVAAATLPIPTALATGGAGAFWNPAQLIDSARVRLSIDGIQTPATVGATGVLATATVRIDRAGRVGLVYGHMGLGGLVRTSYSPDEDEGSIPYYTEALAGVWSGTFRSTTVGAALGYHEVRLDQVVRNRITFDVGASQRINDVLRVAAATHFFSHFQTNHPAQDLYGAVDFRFFRGPLWDGGPVANLRARYGVTLGHGFGADHSLGAGIDFGDPFSFDLLVARDGGYSDGGWRGVAGVRVTIGRYHITFARDGGTNGVGSAFRVGLEANLP